jgi:hypothetical protein
LSSSHRHLQPFQQRLDVPLSVPTARHRTSGRWVAWSLGKVISL